MLFCSVVCKPLLLLMFRSSVCNHRSSSCCCCCCDFSIRLCVTLVVVGFGVGGRPRRGERGHTLPSRWEQYNIYCFLRVPSAAHIYYLCCFHILRCCYGGGNRIPFWCHCHASSLLSRPRTLASMSCTCFQDIAFSYPLLMPLLLPSSPVCSSWRSRVPWAWVTFYLVLFVCYRFVLVLC